MADTLRPTVYRLMQEYANRVNIERPQIDVSKGSKNGDSYSGEVYRVTIHSKDVQSADVQESEELKKDPKYDQLCARNPKGKRNPFPTSLHFIVKIPPKVVERRQMYHSAQHFAREQYVFEHVLPELERFQFEANLDSHNAFLHYPRMVRASSVEEDEFVVLNDLTKSGYRNPERTKPLSYDRCVLVMTQLARLHAISFAFKDQQPEEFNAIAHNLTEIMFKEENEAMDGFLRTNISYAITTLDPQKDEEVLKRITAFAIKYGWHMVGACMERQDAVILHGDCWISNMMFKEKATPDGQEKVVFLDWQVSRYGSVAIDLSHFICCCTDAELRLRLPELLKLYHKELVQRIDQLGSNGKKLFPYHRLIWHMENYARFGFGMSVMSLHATCYPAEKLVNVSDILDKLSMSYIKDLSIPMIRTETYRKRMSDICRDMVRFDYL